MQVRESVEDAIVCVKAVRNDVKVGSILLVVPSENRVRDVVRNLHDP